MDVQRFGSDSRTLGDLPPAALAATVAVSLALVAWPATAAPVVTRSGDTSPQFTPGPTVDLTGQRIFLGFTNGAVGTQGTLSVTGGGSLTAAQIVPGVGGLLGTGFVTVDGAGSVIHLTGGGAFNGLDIGSWGTGVVTVSNGGSIACASPLACPFNDIGNAAGSTGTLAINGGSVSGLGQLAVGLGNLSAGFGTAGANTSATLSITNAGTLSSTGFNSIANNSVQTGLVTGNVTIDGAGSSWAITRDLANGGGQAFLSVATAANSTGNVTVSNGGNLSVTGSRSNPATDNSLPGLNMSVAAGATSTMTVTTGGSVRVGGDSGVFTVGGGSSASSLGASATLNITAGGTVSGTGPNGLVFMSIGQNLGTGTVNVSGVGSQLVVAGVGGQNTQGLDGLGGLIQVGRNHGFGGGSGALNVSGGGSVLISDNGLTASTGSMGLQLATGVGSSGSVTVDGVGSSIVVSTTGAGPTTPYVIVGNGGDGQMTISNGGSVSVLGGGQRNFTVGNSGTGSGTLTVTTGGLINVSRFAVGDNGGSGVATIDHSTVHLDGAIFNNGLDGTPSGAGVRVGRGVGANGVLNLQNGATINIDNSFSGANVLLGGTGTLAAGTGTLNMSGASSINFTGSAASASLQVGATNGGVGIMTMTGNSVVNMGATGNVIVANSAGSTGTLSVSGGSVINTDLFHVGGTSDTVAGGNGSAIVTGAGSLLNVSGADGFVGVGRGGTGALTVSNQATVSAIIMNVGRATGGVGTLTVDNAVINLSGQQTTGTFSGAALSIGNRGGAGSATVTNGSQINITNLGSSGASLNVGGTATNPLGNGILTVSGASTINVTAAPGLATFSVGRDGIGVASLSGGSSINIGDGSTYVGRLAGGSGTLTLTGGSTLNAGNVNIGANPDGVPAGIGNVSVSGAGSALNTGGSSAYISVGNGGTGTLSLANQATAATTVMSIGRNAGGAGTLSVDNATVNLSGQQTTGGLYGAALAVGNLGGTGTASISNRSVVNITNMGSAGAGLFVGGAPTGALGAGTLTVSNSQINVIAAPGQASMVVGHDGAGTATITNSTLQIGSPTLLHDGPLTLTGGDGSLIIAGQPGSTGTLTLNAGSVVNAGYVGVGASPTGPGGAGHLILNNSTINTTTFEIGALGVLSGDGGTINASGSVLVAGTISPGNSPGRINVNCNFISLPGSRLVLDVLDTGSGFSVDHLIFGSTASFILSDLQIVFNFLGNTDPTAFAASGGFDLDNFLETENLDTGVISGLSTVFGPDQTWTNVIDPSQITLVSSVLGTSNLQLQGDGGFVGYTTAPVPEPSTWAMLGIGLLVLGMMTRRRQIALIPA